MKREEYAMYPENMKSFIIAIITVVGFLLATPVANAVRPPPVNCTTTISDGSTINTTLIVPANTTCTLNNVTVTSNVVVGQGATLKIAVISGQKVTINGNVDANHCSAVSIITAFSGATASIRRQCQYRTLYF
jgi:hypothetical protein